MRTPTATGRDANRQVRLKNEHSEKLEKLSAEVGTPIPFLVGWAIEFALPEMTKRLKPMILKKEA